MMQKASKEQIETWIRGIDQFKTDGVGTTRLPFSGEDMQARAYLMKEMEALGMMVSVDSIGNICGRFQGTDSSLAPVWTGSHIDTVIEAGMFDGVAGVVCGMEAVRLMKEAGITPKRDICVRVYTSEESTRFSIGCIGSRAMAGHLKETELETIHDLEGNTLKDLLIETGFDISAFDQIPVQKGSVHAAVELHIEQSRSLVQNEKQIGLVDAICAPTNLIATIEGEQSHAGGTSMQDRKDAFAAVCEIGMELEELVKHAESAYTTGTIGYIEMTPNAVNVIPGKVVFSIDIRDCDYDSKNHIAQRLTKKMYEIAEKRQVKLTIEEKSNDVPMPCDPRIIQALEQSCKNQNKNYMHTISGAYHDSLFIGEFAPIGMIFVPSKDGISHSPAEWTDFADIAEGADVLAETLLALANES
ncbi:MAG: M20 family metallo-hydrolase [Clostridia bacterium]|nr:M20 family metallo-hydrolase [Clostridia bacterium]